MACHHKFQSYLNLQRIDFKPTTLIVGTFNPAWPEGNYSEWFYGRTANNYFWDILPRMFSEKGLRYKTHVEWKRFCKQHKVALTDLITSIDDADIDNQNHLKYLKTYADSTIASKFKRYKFTNVTDILKSYPSIKSVYLTTRNRSKFWDNLWDEVRIYSNDNGIRNSKLITPSKNVRFSMKKGSGILMPDFIFNDWNSNW